MLDRLPPSIQQRLQLVMKDEHWQKARQLRDEVEKAFTQHPEQTGETYLQHLLFTAKMSLHFVLVSLVMFIHGLFPFLFTRAASGQIERVYLIMKSRVPKPTKLSMGRIFKKSVRTEPHQEQRVGIVGGGFSGTLVLANLVKLLDEPLTIEWFDESETIATGIAYGTNDTAHLLNVRAGRMGAFAENPTGFYEWLQTDEGKAGIAKYWADRELSEDSYLPRTLYGLYLKSIYDETLAIAKEKNIEIRITQARVTDAQLYNNDTEQLILSVEKGGITKEVLVDALVLATGNLPPRHFSFQPGLIRGVKHYVADVWKAGKDSIFPEQVSQLSADTDIVIIGTGLTMVDAVLTLQQRGYKGTITALSRHGWLPAHHAHSKPYPKWDWTTSPDLAPRTVRAMLKTLRREIKKATLAGYDWRSVIDSLRPITQQLWQRLSTTEKRKFLSRVLTLWNIHRHRMAPDIHAKLKSLQQSGALKVIPARIYYVGSDEEGLTIAYRKRGANRIETIRSTLVLNCTGPEYDIASSSHHLLKNLRDRGLITVGPLRMGVEITSSGSANGKASDIIYPIGTLLIGELLECTAVPELRDQANTIAAAVANQLQQLRDKNNVENRLLGAWI